MGAIIQFTEADRPTFGIIRKMCDRTVKIQICVNEIGNYMDYRCIEDVPNKFDDMKVFGIGLVRSGYRGKDAINIGRYAYAIEIRILGDLVYEVS